ncbi:MAG: ribonuclease P protein component, partial [Acidimicrobiaceae bacterium]
MISRIQTRQIFQRLQTEGTYVRSGTLWCSMIIDQTLTQPAVAYALGKQVGGAVQRNLLRRRLRELLKARTHKVLPGFYLVGCFDGQNKWIDISNNFFDNGSINQTISVWFFPTSD